eukprot:CAMPEP_0170511004 /NCGR_PEP_ID=MMETSP0208-20121228/66068_1 /TAXON_ID=197538 /ORGANISM="Strombidium inclinatum, Strain S3" /LENGTH=54 /DNA_ID=CAMNT_0010794505 /DNA_START=2573 /DNA_END=2737 /DNA_ORIENTATION=+
MTTAGSAGAASTKDASTGHELVPSDGRKSGEQVHGGGPLATEAGRLAWLAGGVS